MRINNNVMALNAHRQLGINQSGASKSMEKLSSGFRINRAGDDAAGLAISEKMRGQIRGLKQATRNAQDGISLIQTAEGALNETHAILQRMRELAVQSSTDTNEDPDRIEIQEEINQLAEELNRISTDTEFNNQKLLDGNYADKIFHIGANKGQNVSLSIGNMNADTLGVAAEPGVEFAVSDTETVAIADLAIAEGEYTIVELDDATVANDAGTDTGYNFAIMDGADYVAVSKDGQTWQAVTSANANSTIDDVDINGATAFDLGVAVTSGTLTVSDATGDVTISGTASVDFTGDATIATGTYTVATADVGLELQNEAGEVVATGDGTAWVDLEGTALFTTSSLVAGDELEITSGGIDVSTQGTADAAIKTINDAITQVSAERSKLGAMQNRLEHTISNLGTSAENLQAAEARIRDLDMAEEIMAFTKNNILQQAATAMLAQANMAPQSVLQLLG